MYVYIYIYIHIQRERELRIQPWGPMVWPVGAEIIILLKETRKEAPKIKIRII